MGEIVIARSSGMRLYPPILVMSTLLPPVYDRPMMCNPASVLVLANIWGTLIISILAGLLNFKWLLGNGKR